MSLLLVMLAYVSRDYSQYNWILMQVVEGVIDKKQWVAFLAELDKKVS